jgi:hypothetical protein
VRRAGEASFDRRVGAIAQWPVDRAAPLFDRLGRATEPAERSLDRVLDRLESRPPFNSPWVRQRLVGWLLPLWFLLLIARPVVDYLTHEPTICFDCRLYVAASRAWLEGTNPWEVTYRGLYYAAPPPSLLPLAPFTILPTPFDWMAVGVLVVAATILTIRMLRLPWWWLLFPPVVQGVLSGNVQMLLIPLILAGGGWLAALLKIYALVPLAFLGKWRQVGLALLIILVTIPILPWTTYLANLSVINERLDAQTGYGLTFQQSALLFLPALVGFAAIGREKSAWLAVPALWPSQQWYYSSLALPVRSALVGALIAVPMVGSGALAMFAYATLTVLRRRRASRAAAPQDHHTHANSSA